MTSCGMCDNVKEVPPWRRMTRRGRLLTACSRKYCLALPGAACHAKDSVFYGDKGMLCRGVEPAIAALTSVSVKIEYAQEYTLPNSSPFGSAKLCRTTKRTERPKGYIHSVEAPRAMKCPQLATLATQPSPKSNMGKDEQGVKI
jgi:hypothetical protein